MITVYEAETGRIKYFADGDPPAMQATKDSLTDPWVDGEFHWDTHYVSDGVATLRPDCPATVSGLILLNVPVPAEIHIGRNVYQADDSTVELEFNLPGTYKVKVVSFPYLDKEFTIENPTS